MPQTLSFFRSPSLQRSESADQRRGFHSNEGGSAGLGRGLNFLALGGENCAPRQSRRLAACKPDDVSDTAVTWGPSGPSLLLFMRLRGKDSNLDYLIQSHPIGVQPVPACPASALVSRPTYLCVRRVLRGSFATCLQSRGGTHPLRRGWQRCPRSSHLAPFTGAVRLRPPVTVRLRQ